MWVVEICSFKPQTNVTVTSQPQINLCTNYKDAFSAFNSKSSTENVPLQAPIYSSSQVWEL